MDITDLNPSLAGSAGAIVATADSLNRFYGCLLAGELLEPAGMEQMLTFNNTGNYGLGIHRVELPCGLELWGHFGGIFGYLTCSYHSTDAARHVTLSCLSVAASAA